MTAITCPNCEREITATLTELAGVNRVVDLDSAGEPPEDPEQLDRSTAVVTATVTLACGCSAFDTPLDGIVTSYDDLPAAWNPSEVEP